MVYGDLGIDELAAQCLETFVRAFFVRPHQPRIARHIGRKDGGLAARLAQGVSSAAKRRPDRISSRCSGFRRKLASGITTGVTARSRLMISRASSRRPIWA